MSNAQALGHLPVEKDTKVPRHGRTLNAAMPGGFVPVAVLAVERQHEDADWTVRVSRAGEESVVAVSRACSRDLAVEIAWRDVCMAAARMGKGA